MTLSHRHRHLCPTLAVIRGGGVPFSGSWKLPPWKRAPPRRTWRRPRMPSCCLSGTRVEHQSEDPETRFEDIAGDDVPTSWKKATETTTPRIFNYAELYIGTRGFSDDELLGSGGFGRVYRAVLPSDGTLVAVKRVANGRAAGDCQMDRSFVAELAAVAQLRHRNLVRLRGLCVHDYQLLLVYDYMPNRSLDRVLFSSPETTTSPLCWARRWRVAAGLAAALFYLHEQLDTQIIHRDVKASNVMLDADFNARLGDFGLARWVEHVVVVADGEKSMSASASMKDHQFRIKDTTQVGGTMGYLPPESFQKRGPATAKSDVFSFGVVALEVAAGRRAIDIAYPDDQISLLDWARQLSDQNQLLNVVDHRLPDGSYSLSDMKRLIHLGLLCSLHDPTSRPTMRWIVDTLAGEHLGELPALPQFQSHYPQYLSMSLSSSTTNTTTSTMLDTMTTYATAGDTTVFITAEDTKSGTGKLRRCHSSLPAIDTPRKITFKEILTITNNFSGSNVASELDFGTCYHGYLDSGSGRHRVLVKRLGMRTCPALRERFSVELHNLGSLRHRNLVQLRGWCTEQGEMLVVYDYGASGGVLGRRLFGKSSTLTWHERYHIVKSLASAVLYLHEEWEEKVIHRNITSSAVFLDDGTNPRLGCFALAEFLSRKEHGHHVAGTTAGTRGIFGRMSPEYMDTGVATTASDVYSFGVVVLEVVTGSPAVDFRRPEALLVDRLRRHQAKKRPLEELADRRLATAGADSCEVTRLLKLGAACTRSDAETRPSMKQVVRILGENDELLKMLQHRKEGKEAWENRNASALSSIRRIQALGIH